MSAYSLESDYTEETVATAIEAYLAILSFPFLRARYSVELLSKKQERIEGADGRLIADIRGFVPFYMQFKRPSAFRSGSSSKIMKDRKNVEGGPLQSDPRALFFGLRDRRDATQDYQHNVLFRLAEKLRKDKAGDAVYVCPLFLDRSAYIFHVRMAAWRGFPFFWRDPWDLKDVLVNSKNGHIRFERVPVLVEHVSIPPHALVTDAKHRYSFSESGMDVCFHSPTSLPETGKNLGAYLKGVAQLVDDEQSVITEVSSDGYLKSLTEAVLAGTSFRFPTADRGQPGRWISEWSAWGDFLSTEYGIGQYAMVLRK